MTRNGYTRDAASAAQAQPHGAVAEKDRVAVAAKKAGRPSRKTVGARKVGRPRVENPKGVSQVVKLRLEMIDQERRERDEHEARAKRLAERDAAYEAAFPGVNSGARRGRIVSGRSGSEFKYALQAACAAWA